MHKRSGKIKGCPLPQIRDKWHCCGSYIGDWRDERLKLDFAHPSDISRSQQRTGKGKEQNTQLGGRFSTTNQAIAEELRQETRQSHRPGHELQEIKAIRTRIISRRLSDPAIPSLFSRFLFQNSQENFVSELCGNFDTIQTGSAVQPRCSESIRPCSVNITATECACLEFATL